MKRYAAPGMTSFYVLNHRLENDELRRQLDELKAAGFRGFFMHPRPGLMTPYLTQQWWDTIQLLIEHAVEIGLDAWLYDENPFPSGGAGGKVVYDNPEYRARYLEHKAARARGGEAVQLDLPAGRLIRAFALRLDENQGDASSQDLKFTGETLDITAQMGWVAESWDQHYRHYHFYFPPYQQTGNPHWRAWTDWPFLRLEWTAPTGGDWLVCAFAEREFIFPSFGYYLDFYNPRAVDAFLETTHREYSRRFGKHLGKTVPGIFTDEPKFMDALAWSPVLEEEFPRRAGYDVRDYLPHLLYSIDGNTPAVRRDFRAVASQMFIDAFCKPIHYWAEEHGIASTGHASPEEEPLWQSTMTPDLMEWLKWFQIPGVDLIGGHIGDARYPLLNMGPKLVSSVAHQNGRAQVLCEAWGAGGWELSLADMKKMADWLFVLGVNLICAHAQFYSIDGYRKREAAPSQFYQASYWPYFSELSSYLEKTGEALTGGRHHCKIAILHPQTTLSALLPDREDEATTLRDELSQTLFSLLGAQRDFDFLNEISLQNGAVENGALRVGDEKYRVLILPQLQLIEEKTAQQIARFVESGGRVLALGGAPQSCVIENQVGENRDATSPADRFIKTPPFDFQASDNAQLLSQLDAILPRVVRLEGANAGHVFVLHRTDAAQRELLFVFNTRDEAFDGSLHVAVDTREYSRALQLPPHGSLLLYLDEWEDAAPESNAPREYSQVAPRTLDISRDWVLERAADNVLLLAKLHVVAAEKEGAPPRVTNAFVADVCETYDLPPQLQSASHLWYCALFGARGVPEKLALSLEEAGVQRPYEVWINETRADQPQRAPRYDTKNYETEIAPLLRSSADGEWNQLSLRVPNLAPQDGTVLRGAAARPVMEAPRLFGDFALYFPYGGYENRAQLRFDRTAFHATHPTSWADCGWPHYSGTVRYSKTVSLSSEAAAALRVLAFSEVRDLVRVTVNGEVLETRVWAPFEVEVAGKLRAGDNEFLLEVANSPINLMEGVARKSGLFGAMELR